MATDKKIDYVLLGLLSHEPMTGYEIKRRIDVSLKLFWSASYGSIYPALNALEKSGAIVKKEIKDTKREKIQYSITEEGREILREWLKKPVVKDEIRFETILKLFFGSEVEQQFTLEHIDAFEQKAKEVKPMLQTVVNQLEPIQEERTHQHYLLAAKFGVKIYDAFLEWCEESKEVLEKEQKKEDKNR